MSNIQGEKKYVFYNTVFKRQDILNLIKLEEDK